MDAVFRSVKRVCDAGLDSLTLRREVAARLAPAIGFDAYAFCTCDPDAGLISHAVAQGVSHELAAAYVDWASLRPWARRAAHGVDSAPTVVTVQPPLPAAAMSRDVQLHVTLATRGRVWGTLCLLGVGGTSAHVDRACALLTRLAPHLVRGMQTATRCGEERAATEAMSDAEPGVLVLDERHRVTMRTPAATRWLEDLADVGLRLPDDLPLAALALAARAANRGEARVRACGHSGRWYLLRASLAEPCGPDPAARAVVVIVRPATSREVAAVRMRLCALSAREHEIIAAVARGESTKAIAAALGRSPHTVYEHIDRACQKLGVRGRKALVATLFVGATPAPGGAAAASVAVR